MAAGLQPLSPPIHSPLATQAPLWSTQFWSRPDSNDSLSSSPSLHPLFKIAPPPHTPYSISLLYFSFSCVTHISCLLLSFPLECRRHEAGVLHLGVQCISVLKSVSAWHVLSLTRCLTPHIRSPWFSESWPGPSLAWPRLPFWSSLP